MTNRPTPHSAAGPALGYLYQFEAAFLRLLPHALAGHDVEVTLEVVDDVAFNFSAGLHPREVIQVHHSLGTATLSDKSAKVWRTLAIWASEWSSLDGADTVDLILLSTQETMPGSGIRALTNSGRDVPAALELLTSVAQDTEGADGTSADRATFLALDPDQRTELLNRITVLDGSTMMIGMREELVGLLRPTHESKYIASMADALEGWWWPRVAVALTDKSPIHADELRAKVDEARRELSDRALPIMSIRDFLPDELPPGDPAGAHYVECLHAIEASAVRRDVAIQDYRRAFAHRSRWARRGLLGPRELDQYEDDLFAEWLIRCDQMLRDVADEKDASARSGAGHQLWDRMETEVHRPLRAETTDGFLLRGSLHQLAEDHRLAWHPDAAAEHFDTSGGDAT